MTNLSEKSSKKEIRDKTRALIEKKKISNRMRQFFINVKKVLLKASEEEEKDHGDDFIETEYQPDSSVDKHLADRRNSTTIVEDNHAVLRQRRLLVGQGAGMDYIQGQMNPTFRHIKKQIVNIDSKYRKMLQCQVTQTADCPGGTCPDDSVKLADKATDFILNLSHPVTNVLKMALYSYEIPYSWYVFDDTYGTTSFSVSIGGVTTTVTIAAGNYTRADLITTIQTAVTAAGLPLTLTYNADNNKVTISGFPATTDMLIFYDTTLAPTNEELGAKLDYNLGWLLGFRQPTYSGSTSYLAESLVDTYGFRYLFLEIDDFQGNRLSQNVVSLSNNRDTFKYSAQKRCAPTELPPSTSTCGKPPPAWNGPTLTANQNYVRSQILNAQQTPAPDRYYSPVNSNILARIPVRKVGNYDLLYESWNSSMEDTAREYFGPVTLRRLRVRLLNDKGYTIDLNGMDFSFALLIEHLYQY